MMACLLLQLVPDASPIVRYEVVVAMGNLARAHSVLFCDAATAWKQRHFAQAASSHVRPDVQPGSVSWPNRRPH
jgi:hypothetical protein